MIVLLAVPLAAWVRGLSGWQARARQAVVAGAVALLVMAPWVVANLVRFEHPATLSTQAGPTLDVANCDETYYGDALGAWSFACATAIDEDDRSVLDQRTREEAFTYIGDHVDRLPVVVAARLGRAVGPLRALRPAALRQRGRGPPAAVVAGGAGHVLRPGRAHRGGRVAFRRRGEPSFPLTVWLVNVADHGRRLLRDDPVPGAGRAVAGAAGRHRPAGPGPPVAAGDRHPPARAGASPPRRRPNPCRRRSWRRSSLGQPCPRASAPRSARRTCSHPSRRAGRRSSPPSPGSRPGSATAWCTARCSRTSACSSGSAPAPTWSARRCTTSTTRASATSPCGPRPPPRWSGPSCSTGRSRRGRCGASRRRSATSGPRPAGCASTTRSTSRRSASPTPTSTSR